MANSRSLFLLNPQRLAVNFSSNGNNTVIAAVAGQIIKVTGIILVASSDVDMTFKETVSGTALTGPISMGVKGNGFVMPPSLIPWLQLGVSQGLNIFLSAGVQISGSILYTQD